MDFITEFWANYTSLTRLDRQKHRYTLQDPSRSSPRAFWSSSPFLQGLVLIFGPTTQFSEKNVMLLNTGAKQKNDFRGYLAKNHEVIRTDKLALQTNYKSGKTDECVRKLSENYGEHSE